MNLVSLSMHNFMSYKDEVIDFTGVDTSCLYGENGAGKSAMLDAITWALWGKGRVSRDDELMRTGTDEMFVALEFELGGHNYHVLRQRQHGARSVLELQRESSSGLTRLTCSTIRETQAAINNLLKVEYQTFINSAFILQGRANEFTSRPPRERKQVLFDILDLGSWQYKEEKVKGRAKLLDTEIVRAETEIEHIMSGTESLNADRAVLERSRQDLVALDKSLAVAEHSVNADKETRNRLYKLYDQRIGAEAAIQGIVTLKQATEKALSEYRADFVQLDADVQSGAATKWQADVDKLTASIEAFKADREAQNVITSAASQEKGAIEADWNRTLKRIETLQADEEPMCPTCGRPMSLDEREGLLDGMRGYEEERRRALNKAEDALEESYEVAGAILRTIDSATADLSDMMMRKGYFDVLDERHADVLAKIKTGKEKLEEHEETIAASAEAVVGIDAEIREIEEELAHEENWTEEDVVNIRKKRDVELALIAAKEERVRSLEAELALVEDIKEIRANRMSELDICTTLRGAFGAKGIPAMIVEQAIPEIERYANELLMSMTGGNTFVQIETTKEKVKGGTAETLDIIVFDEMGRRDYDLFSGGEEFRIDLALRIALSKLLASRAGASLRTLVIDEGFGTQDNSGIEGVMQAIGSIQDDFDKVIVITHIDEVKEMFPGHIEVTKDADGSHVTIH